MDNLMIAIHQSHMEHALKTLQAWVDGEGLPAKGALSSHQGSSVGVTAQFHGQLGSAAEMLENFAAEIRTSLSRLREDLVATVADLGSVDDEGSAIAKGMLAQLAPAAPNVVTAAVAPLVTSASDTAAAAAAGLIR